MEAASSYAYVSKRKVRHVNRFKKHQNGNLHEESRSRSRSVERVSSRDLNAFSQQDLKLPPLPPGDYEQEVDTNVMAVKVGKELEKRVLSSGDLIRCSKCKAALSIVSKETMNFADNVWRCEFCHTANKIVISKDKFPESSSLDYAIGVADEVKLDERVEESKDSDINVVFAIDVSGSMDEMVRSASGSTTRIQCVRSAINKQLDTLRDSSPNVKVGLVFFNGSVIIYGDCSQKEEYVSWDVATEFASLVEFSVASAGKCMKKSVKEQHDTLARNVSSMYVGGGTALGPALLAATCLAARGKKGSKVLICTDGMANTGLGSNGGSSDKTYYESVGKYARSMGVAVTVVSIVDSECRLDLLSPLAILTGGSVIKVDPQNLTETFSSVVGESTLATNAEVKLFLHKSLEFRNEDDKQMEEMKTVLCKPLGNLATDAVVTFEYHPKSSKELAAMSDVDLEKLDSLPFQAQIQYTGPDENRYLKVITSTQFVTNDKAEARKAARPEIVSMHAKIKTAELASKKDLTRAMTNAVVYARLTTNVQEYQKDLEKLYGAIQQESQTTHLIPDSQSDSLIVEINHALKGKKK